MHTYGSFVYFNYLFPSEKYENGFLWISIISALPKKYEKHRGTFGSFLRLERFSYKLVALSDSIVFNVQSTQGWLSVCHCCFMSIDWINDIDVLSIYWSWRTSVFEAVEKTHLSWFVLHILGGFAASLWILHLSQGALGSLLLICCSVCCNL